MGAARSRLPVGQQAKFLIVAPQFVSILASAVVAPTLLTDAHPGLNRFATVERAGQTQIPDITANQVKRAVSVERQWSKQPFLARHSLHCLLETRLTGQLLMLDTVERRVSERIV